MLITAAPIPVIPAKVNREALAKSDIGRPIRIVGFGQTTGGASKPTGRRNQGVTTIASLDDMTFVVQSVPNICLVDSGGPTFSRQNGEDVVVGIHSIIDSISCAGEGADVRVDRYTDFIDAEVAKADPPNATTETSSDAEGETAEETAAAATTETSSGCTLVAGDRSSWTGNVALVGVASIVCWRRRRLRHARGRTRRLLRCRSRCFQPASTMPTNVSLLLGASFLLLVASCGGGVAEDSYVLRVDHEWDASVNARFTLAEDTYAPRSPRDAYRVVFGGDTVEVTSLADTAFGTKGTVVTGARSTSRSGAGSGPHETTGSFELDEGEGELVVRGDVAVLTRFGSGIPVLSSERGTLVPRRDETRSLSISRLRKEAGGGRS